MSRPSLDRHVFIPAPVPTSAEDDPDSAPAPLSNALVEFYKRNEGLFIIATGQFFSGWMTLCVKVLTLLEKPVPTFELVAVRMAITYICCQVYMFASGVADPILGPKGIRMWLVIRGVVGFFGLSGLYYSLQYMSLSDATVLTFLSPNVTAALGFLFLREAVSWKQAAAGVTSLLGVILIAKPTFLFGGGGKTDVGAGEGGPVVTEAQRMVAVGVALVGVFCAAGAYISVRVIGKRAHPMHIISYFSLWCVIVATIGMPVAHTEWVLPMRWTWLDVAFDWAVWVFGAAPPNPRPSTRNSIPRHTSTIHSNRILPRIRTSGIRCDSRRTECHRDVYYHGECDIRCFE
ncbi:hypothetical protein FS749_012343 [Ceratobasidium sp. UAMH 11750]|nr:hypothetical protein FS749_012343 [Ceratobasidium sp. UAMH 11750]